ncbi:MAG: acetate--CoA ligase family protein [Alphaproteobacteria bacterium]|nr:acetate--CoA ligase family protein [Alphaproteobacteria bacterium]
MTARVDGIRHYAAGNRFARDPVAVARIVVPPPVRPDARLLDAIAAALPELVLPVLADGDDAAAFGAVAVALTAEILRRAGDPIAIGRVVAARDASTIDILFSGHSEMVGTWGLQLALELLGGAHRDGVGAAVEDFVAWARPLHMNLQDARLAAVAGARGVPWRPSAPGHGPMLLGEGVHLRRTFSNKTDRSGFIAIETCTSKRLTNRALEAAGLPVPRQRRADGPREAVRAAEALGYPVVMKPEAASRGAGVVCDLGSAAEVAAAFAGVRRHGPVLVETFARGDDHRLMVIGGKYFSCMRRRAAAVRGDGVRTVAALAAAESERRRRAPETGGILLALPLDAEADRVLARQGLDRRSVLPAGAEARLRSVSNWSQGGTFDYPRAIHPANVRLAERVAALFGLDIVGVDLIAPDLARPFHEVGAVIHEVQRQPTTGPRNLGVYERLMDHVVPPGGPFRIPVVVVAGGEAGAVAARIAARLQATGRRVGVAGAAGLGVGRLRRSGSDRRGDGLPLLVDDPSVEAAVAEIDPRRLVAAGLGHPRLDVAVVAGGGLPGAAADILARLADRGVVCAAADQATRAAAGRARTACATVEPADGGRVAADAMAAAAVDLLGIMGDGA